MGDISLKGYHGTCSFARKSIESKGLDPEATTKRNNHWLGNGVYFFEDFAIAKWWAVGVASKNHGSLPIIYGACIVVEEKQGLDLDNNEEQAKFRHFVEEKLKDIEALCKEDDIGYPTFSLEQFRGVFFDYYKREFGIKVVIATFNKDFVKYAPYYPTKKVEQDFNREFSRAFGVTYKEKQICVSDGNCIRDYKEINTIEEAEVV